ncbi:hypothetical protein CRM22_006904 [Opisthorchis felineus]|uniref:Annexin n=1 Tax=Opisthorchis felineus TaxID=147828 RepID=A0A4S2LQA9_OPIFE|nr:hypothetical protein CRM22_006904 [Opisthorchis felineus]
MQPGDYSAWNLGNQLPQGQYPNCPSGYPPGSGYPNAPPYGYPGQVPGQTQPGYQPHSGFAGQPQSWYQPQPGYAGQPQPGYQPQPVFAGQSQPWCHPQPGYTGQPVCYNPTLKPYPNFNPDQDCEKLRKAMKGVGTDEKAIIDVLAHRTADQRVQIVKKFKTAYGKDLIHELKSELTGHFEEVIVAMCYTLEEFDARELRRAMEGAGTDEQTLIEILCSRSNAQIRKIKEVYHSIFSGRDLEKDLMNETHGHFKRILISLAQANRDENPNVDMNAVNADVHALYEAGEKQLGTDESTFNRILVSKSEAHVRAVINAYGSVSKKDFEDALKSEMSGDLLKAFLSISESLFVFPFIYGSTFLFGPEISFRLNSCS